MTFLARLDERERLIAALIAMCLFAAALALTLHGQLGFRPAAIEQGSLAAPAMGDRLHETAGAGAVPPDVSLGTGDAGGSGGNGGGGGSDTPRTTPPNEPPQNPPEEPPGGLISRILHELPGLPPPPFSSAAFVRNALR